MEYQKMFRYNKSDVWGNWMEFVSEKEKKRTHWGRRNELRDHV